MNEMASSKSFNMIYCWGKSSFGQLGVGGTEVENSEALQTPSLLSYFNKNGLQVKTISCGWNHTVFLSGSGILYSCGSNDAGQLGHGKSFSKPGKLKQVNTFEPSI